MASIVAIVVFGAVSAALPEVAFPFNSQVPTVARVAEAYSFQFADATFQTDGSENLTYVLSNPPAWLNLDSATRSLYGTPGQGNSGPNTFTIVAAGTLGAARMECMLVVADNAPPQVAGNMSELLAAAGTLSGSTSLLLQPSSAFTISFGEDVFQDDPGRIQAYYATLSDHTPLPSWLQFEESAVSFWGIAPAASDVVQEFAVDLIASDVIGFAGAVTTFTLVVSSETLEFKPQQESMDVAAGTLFKHQSLLSQLFLDGKAVQRSQIKSASAQVPAWLSFDNVTLDLTGTPTSSFRSVSVKISVTDTLGDTAVKDIYLHADNSSFYTGEIGNLTATAGQPFVYTIASLIFDQSGLNVSLDTGAATSWLTFDSATLQLHGTPPTSTKSSSAEATIIASSLSLSRSESQIFNIQINAPAAGGSVPTSTRLTFRTSPTNESTPTALGAPPDNSSDKSNTVGIIVGAVIGSLALLALLFAVLMLLCRRRRRDPSRNPGKLNISRPIIPQQHWVPMANSEEANDCEKAAGETPPGEVDRAPHLSLNLIPSSFSVPQSNKRVSTASSIGNGEGVLLADSNIPTWGRESRASHTPHDSYSAATELARRNSQHTALRLSAPARLSPNKRTSRTLRSWQASHSAGLGINVHGTVLRRSRRRSNIDSGLSLSRNPSSSASLNTHGTSLLSTRLSDFPEPQHSEHRSSRSIPTVSLIEADKRRSIRLISRSNSSTADTRPLAEKRQSFIRHRASSSIISPLFASSRRSSNLNEAIIDNASGLQLSQSLRRGRSHRTAFSASSSLEPPARNPRRLVSNSASVFAPNFPRAITPSPVRGQPSPTLPVTRPPTGSDSDLYDTTTGTTSSSSRRQSDTDAANAELARQLALPRHERSWVLPHEASPTPPPSSATREFIAREQARRKWANRLNRDSRGGFVSRSPSPVRINLRTTAVEIGTGKENEQGSKGSLKKAGLGMERLTKLVSNDSLSSAMRNKGTRAVVGRVGSMEGKGRNLKAGRRDEMEGQSRGGATAEEQDDPEWEDVGSGVGFGFGVSIPEGESETLVSTMSGRAFL